MSAKIQEAEEHCKAAEKHLKTSFLKWKPDLDSAADEYNQAAQCYRIARQLKKSMECHMKASEFYLRNRCFFHAGKSLESALLVNKDNATPEEVYSLALESSSLYQQHGSGDSGANILAKAARIIEESSPMNACKLYQMAAEVSTVTFLNKTARFYDTFFFIGNLCPQSESSSHQGIEYTSKATRLLVKMELYDQAADSVRREIGFHLEAGNFGAVGRLTVAAVLIHLARGDIVAAEKSYKEWGSNCEAAETDTLERLLTAYDEEDKEGAKRALASPFIRSMDVEYARLACKVELPKGEPMPSVGIRKNAAPSYVSAHAEASETASSFQAPVSHHRYEDAEDDPYESVNLAKPEAKPEAQAEEDDDEGGFC